MIDLGPLLEFEVPFFQPALTVLASHICVGPTTARTPLGIFADKRHRWGQEQGPTATLWTEAKQNAVRVQPSDVGGPTWKKEQSDGEIP